VPQPIWQRKRSRFSSATFAGGTADWTERSKVKPPRYGQVIFGVAMLKTATHHLGKAGGIVVLAAAPLVVGGILGYATYKIAKTLKNNPDALPSVDQMQIEKSKTNISNWLDKGKTDYPQNRIHFIAFMELLSDGDSVSKNDLERKLGNDFSESVLSDLCSFSGDPHHTNGKIFERTGDEISLWEPIADFARAEWKSYK
jgi:hypothetical protein